MRSSLASAALLSAGLATGPALASSTTIIDFTIEVTEITALGGELDPLFSDKAVGDTFDGILEMDNPPVDLDNRPLVGLFNAVNLEIDSFDPVFFEAPEIFSGGVPGPRFLLILSSLSSTDDPFARFDMVVASAEPISPDVDNLSLVDQLAIFTRAETKRMQVSSRNGFSVLSFDVVSASIRPDTSPIPLPAAGWLMIAGLGGLAALRRRAA